MLRSAIFTFVVPGSVTVAGPLGVLSAWPTLSPSSALLRVIAVPLGAIGLAIYVWCVLDFALAGRGTPAPIDAPRRLVVRGLYRFVRNPMYVGVSSILAAEALWLGSGALAVYALCVWTGFHTFIRLYEEPTLQRLFGDEYTRYLASTPRWLPRAPRNRPGA